VIDDTKPVKAEIKPLSPTSIIWCDYKIDVDEFLDGIIMLAYREGQA
jgi:hypothetical protein